MSNISSTQVGKYRSEVYINLVISAELYFEWLSEPLSRASLRCPIPCDAAAVIEMFLTSAAAAPAGQEW